ncbi:hypothetical protein [Hyphomonas atlantica]|uniref:Uncharacterized protein n=1 Tax=Hyphomonas atlantica TaxID=1280948 RepID=A0A059EBI1_9PROT|nr:hypothetical protein [Hyphomonas atlantica]KCZ64940.1 hypothetical protein HY36_00795 [Hyphomonas atlantica]HAE95136.1 hypothetical protein [Hyphomonas atlantica]HBH45187.1 hypothetical protein [Hyphomonas atlantica]
MTVSPVTGGAECAGVWQPDVMARGAVSAAPLIAAPPDRASRREIPAVDCLEWGMFDHLAGNWLASD